MRIMLSRKRFIWAIDLIFILILILSAASAHAQRESQIYIPSGLQIAPTSPISNAEFGRAVDIDGNRAIVGELDQDSGQPGAAYIYEQDNNGAWQQVIRLTEAINQPNAFYGKSVAIAGDIAVVGAPDYDSANYSNIGTVYVYHRNATTGVWSKVAQLHPYIGGHNQYFGYAVDTDATRIAIGAHQGINAQSVRGGVVYVRHRTSNIYSWPNEDLLSPETVAAQAGEEFGNTVSLNGNNIIVGAPLYDNGAYTNAGRFFIFSYQGNNWVEANRRYGSSTNARLGIDVAMGANFALTLTGGGGAVLWHSNPGDAVLWSRSRGLGYSNIKRIAADGAHLVFSRINTLRVMHVDGSFNMTPVADYEKWDINFGVDVSLGGGGLIIGASWDYAPNDVRSGAAYIAPLNVQTPILGTYYPDGLTYLPDDFYFEWNHNNGTQVIGAWYRLLVKTNGRVTWDKWYRAEDICGASCSVSLANYQGITGNGQIDWSVTAWNATSGMFPPVSASFTLNVPAPTVPASMSSSSVNGAARLEWYHGDDEENRRASWYHIIIIRPGAENYNKWIRAYDYCGDTCEFFPAINWPAGSYQVWMESWGPGGFSTGATDSQQTSRWWRMPDLVLPDVTPDLASPSAFFFSGGQAYASWYRGANATWFQVQIQPEDRSWTRNLGWYDAQKVNCKVYTNDNTCEAEIANFDALSIPAGNYYLRIRSWGPGGFSEGGAQADGFAETLTSYYNAGS